MMSLVEKRLNSVYNKSKIIEYDEKSKFIIMSDCHRGQGNWGDSFLSNQNLYFGAMNHYYKNGFTYLELGDGDELWENRSMKNIINVHSDVFWLMQKFYESNRFYMIYGNHDIVKRRKNYANKNIGEYYQYKNKGYVSLMPDMEMFEGIILKNSKTNNKIFLTHGHQGDMLNDIMWPLARFLVRYVWKPLELIGFLDPTGAGRTHDDLDKSEKRFEAYAKQLGEIMILGHTHRPVFSQPSKGLYFNDGSCVHPRCITGIEIEKNKISLIKWSVMTKEDGMLYVGKEVLENPVKIEQYYVKH